MRTLAFQFNNMEADRANQIKPPSNFQLIKVRPNWHDSSDLLGYEWRISGKERYVVTDFMRFIVKSAQYPKTPFFLCLDEINLAPVEQYFAEYLSVLETRELKENGSITTDALISSSIFKKYDTHGRGTDPDFNIWKELNLPMTGSKTS